MAASLTLSRDTPSPETRFALGAELVVAGSARGPAALESVEIELCGRLTAAHVDGARWQAKVGLLDLPRGAAELIVRARDAGGATAETTQGLDVQPFVDRPRGQSVEQAATVGPLLVCDTPRLGPGAHLVAPAVLSGWAYAPAGVARVSVVVDGRTSHDAAIGLWRGDVAEALGRDDAAGSGWIVTLPAQACPPGEHELTLLAVGTDGRATGVRSPVLVSERRGSSGPGLDGVAAPMRVGPAPRRRTPGELGEEAGHTAAVAEVTRVARYRWAAPLAADVDVLEVGCGDGSATSELGAARSLLAVDRDPIALARAEARGLASALFREWRGGSLPCGDRSFDLVVALSGDVDEVTLPELRRVLRPDGVLVVAGRELGERALREFEHGRVAEQRTTLVAEVRSRPGAPAGLPDGEDAVQLTACSRRWLPELPPAAVRTAPLSVEPWRSALASWVDRALRAEAYVEARTIDAAWAKQHESQMARRLLETEAARAALEERVAELESRGRATSRRG
ncbi:MAG TPA: class I SAM-dependent methyltransferase [Solirubrobacteraceae bacterium]